MRSEEEPLTEVGALVPINDASEGHHLVGEDHYTIPNVVNLLIVLHVQHQLRRLHYLVELFLEAVFRLQWWALKLFIRVHVVPKEEALLHPLEELLVGLGLRVCGYLTDYGC